MSAKKCKTALPVLLVLVIMETAFGASARVWTRQGNKLYGQGKFNEAINKYDEALVEAPQAPEPKFNKANSYYRLDDLGEAMGLYRQVADESKDMKLVAKARYNLGNCSFQQGSKQRDSNLQKAVEDLETAIGSWRGVLDIEPENENAAKNIEVARLMIKDILDQLNKQKQQQDPNQPQDPNQLQQQESRQDPNQPQEPNQPAERPQPKAAPDTTAQEILDRERQQRKARQILRKGDWQKVEKDW